MWFGSKHKWSSGSFFKVSRVRIFLGGHKKDNFYSFHGKYDYEKKKSNFVDQKFLDQRLHHYKHMT